MDLFFTILKFAGAFVSGFGAIIAAIPDSRRGKRSEKSKLKQVWHKLSTKQSGLYIAIIGLLVAMLSQFAETRKSSEESKEAQAKYAAQMSVATNSLAKLENQLNLSSITLNELQSQSHQMRRQLAYMNHIAGEFDTLTIDATFELVSTDSTALMFTKRVADLAHSLNITTLDNPNPNFVTAVVRLSSLVGDDQNAEKPKRGQQTSGGGFTGLMNHEVEPEGARGGIVGTINMPPTYTNSSDITKAVRGAFFSWSHGGIGETAPYDEVFSTNWLASVSSETNFTKLFDCLQLPMLGVRIFSGHTTNLAAADADFFAPPPTSGTIQPTIGYDSVLHGVLINWRIEYPCTEWQQTVRMGTLQDLDAATLCFYLANIPDFLTNDIKPVSLRLKFGKTNIKVSKFELQSYENVEVLFEPTTNIISKNPISHQRDTTESTESYRAAVFKATLPPASYDPIEAENNTSTH